MYLVHKIKEIAFANKRQLLGSASVILEKNDSGRYVIKWLEQLQKWVRIDLKKHLFELKTNSICDKSLAIKEQKSNIMEWKISNSNQAKSTCYNICRIIIYNE